jgi:hypothetical protein
MANRSSFPTTIDTFIELYELPASKASDAITYKTLLSKENKTSTEIEQMNSLAESLKNYLITAETWNRFTDCIVNMELFTKQNITEYYQFKGEYNSSTTYKIFNTVRYNGEIYMALVDTLANIPTDTTKWLKISGKGDKGDQGVAGLGLSYIGDYSSTYAYNVGNAVTYNNKIYYCTQTSIGNIPTNTTYWKEFISAPSTAKNISIEDTANKFTATNVEDALAELKNLTPPSGSGIFNSTTGVTITHNVGVSSYRVSITPTSNSNGTLGEYWVESKTVNTFVVKNSGSNTTCTFDWILIK